MDLDGEARSGGNLQVSVYIMPVASATKLSGKISMTYGRKLQAEAGRLDTRVKISDMSRC